MTTNLQAARPPCFNRPDFLPVGIWRPGCSAWFEGGNAELLPANPHGKLPWSACEGCEQQRKARS